MNIGVTGAGGRLGSGLVEIGCVPLVSDVTDQPALTNEIREIDPDVIINCAAYTDVDGCENPVEFKKAIRVSLHGVDGVLRAAGDRQVIHISTDYVFDGKNGPYDENAKTNPKLLSNYGFAKWSGELVFNQFSKPKDVLVRTTVLYGGNKPDFVTRILDQLKAGQPFWVTKRLIGTPTYVPHLAKALVELAKLEKLVKVVNIAGADCLSRYEFALMVAQVFGYDPDLILPIGRFTSALAPRPIKAGLKTGLAKKLGLPIYKAHQGLEEMKQRCLQA